MPRNDAGSLLHHYGIAVATLSFTPQQDRAAVIKRILIDKVSATDTWIVSSNGRDIAHYYIATTGNQQMFAGVSSAYPKNNDLFKAYEELTGEELSYPVPQSNTFTVTSVGGATADITFSYEEFNNSELSPMMMNHPLGSRFVAPIYFSRAAAVTALGDNAFDTEIKPGWFPSFFTDVAFPQSYNAQLLLLFLEGEGVNTFNGGADHQSTTEYVSLEVSGQRYFTRDVLKGIPLIGTAAAAGAAHATLGTDLTPLPAFQLANEFDTGLFTGVFPYRPGGMYRWRLGIKGDVTGNADYSAAIQAGIVDLRQVA